MAVKPYFCASNKSYLTVTHLILFDGDARDHLLPLTFTRPVADLRVGILRIREKWERRLGLPASFLTQDYLTPLYPSVYGACNLLINGSLLPNDAWQQLLLELAPGQAYTFHDELLAVCLNEVAAATLVNGGELGALTVFELTEMPAHKIRRPADIFTACDTEIRADFSLLTQGRHSQKLSATNTLIGDSSQLFVEEGASVEACILNVTTGPIYVGKDAVLLEGAMLRGPIGLGERSVVKMGAKIYGATAVGPHCKLGGELNNVVMQANSNKGHDGYLGNSVIGEWCNLGADTNNSNLKNDYSEVKVWSYPEQRFVGTGLQFHGLIMGDHSKAGINTMFNTGTVIGVSANIFGEGFPRNFIPSFSWGGASGFQTYRLDKALATAERVIARRGRSMAAAERAVFAHVFDATTSSRPK